MSRSKWKGPYLSKKSLKVFEKLKKNYEKIIIPRNVEILPRFIKKTFKVHNGKRYIEISVIEEMIGHKFGEFCNTRQDFFFKKRNIKK